MMMDGASGPAMTSRRPDGQTASERCHLTLELRRLNCWEFRRPLPGDVRFASQARPIWEGIGICFTANSLMIERRIILAVNLSLWSSMKLYSEALEHVDTHSCTYEL